VKRQTGAARIVEALRLGNVRCVFGLPGTQTLELFEALRQNGLHTVVPTNELSAAFMAGGWARVTGDPGVLLTIPGPGFTWALTGLAEARLDSVPLLHITGAPSTVPPGFRFRQQEVDQAAIASPLVKGVIEADLDPDPGAAVLEGLQLASSGEPGPVLFQVSSITLARENESPKLRAPSTSIIEPQVLEGLITRVRRARRPILLAGQGTNKYPEQIRALVEQLRVPLLTTPSARGVLPEDHPLNFGFEPLVGNIHDVNELIESADLVLAIGCKLGHSGTGGFALKLPADRLVHVDASHDVIGVNYPVSLGVVGDAGDVLVALLKSGPTISAWSVDELESWRIRLAVRTSLAGEPRIAGTEERDARGFFQSLRRALPRDAILVLDSGLHQILARRYYTVLSRCGLIMPTDLQSMGFGIPTAIGVKMATPDRSVVALVGDGGLAMTALDLLTAVKEQISLVVIVFVDGAFGQIRMQQLLNYGSSHGVLLENPDLHLLALAVGASHELVAENNFETAVRNALQRSGVTVIEIPVRDTMAFRRNATVARTREATRRAVGVTVSRRLTTVFRMIAKVLRRDVSSSSTR
jgi:acetolactate synthase I/II/III large subunit